jgi:uncharacterized membrane protein
MRRIQIALTVLVFAALGLAGAAHEPSSPRSDGEASPRFCFNSIDVPGATVTTNAMGINSRGDIVGAFSNSTGTHGYLLSDGQFTTIDYPGAVYTDARGINSRGEIVGSYRMSGEPAVNFHGYLRTRWGDFINVDFPGHTNTIAQRITHNGLILGCRHDADTMETMRGVTINARDQSQFHEIDEFASMNNGATPDASLIVGLYTEMDTARGRGYLLYGDTFIPFDVPDSTFTAAWDVSPGGEVVGVFRNATGFHGFLWKRFRFHTVDYPGATATRVFGINSDGDVVGNYADAAGRLHGFVATEGRRHCR